MLGNLPIPYDQKVAGMDLHLSVACHTSFVNS